MTHPIDEPVSATKETANGEMDAFIQRASRERIVSKPTNSLTQDEYNRRLRVVGLGFGGLSGLILAILSQIVNRVMLPGVPLSHPPFGLIGNLLIILVVGSALGFTASISTKAQDRIIKWGMFLVMVFAIGALVKLGNAFAVVFLGTASFLVLLGIFMALAILLLPYGLLLRWAAQGQVKNFDRPWWYWKRLIPGMLFIGLSLGLGLLFVYTPQERQALHTTNQMLSQARTASQVNDLPEVLQRINGTPFLPYAQGEYVLLPAHIPHIPGQVDNYGMPFSQDAVIGVQYESGYTMVCKLTSSGFLYNCSSDWHPPLHFQNG